MWTTFADPKTDFIFKRIFGAEDRKHLLIDLLNVLLDLDEAHRIIEIQHLPDRRISISELRRSILALRCSNATGASYVVKIQLLHVEGFDKHLVQDAVKAHEMQPRTDNHNPELDDLVGVTISDFAIWPEKSEQGAFQIPMLSLWREQEQHRDELGVSRLWLSFLELAKYAASDVPRSNVEKWTYFFREARHLNAIPPVLAEPPFLEAFEASRIAHFTREEWNVYDRAKIAEQDARGALAMAKRRGHEEGRLEVKRAVLQKLLSGHGLAQAYRARIAACEDSAELDAWIDRVIAGTAPAELFGSA